MDFTDIWVFNSTNYLDLSSMNHFKDRLTQRFCGCVPLDFSQAKRISPQGHSMPRRRMGATQYLENTCRVYEIPMQG